MQNEKKLDRKVNIMVNGKSLGKNVTVKIRIQKEVDQYRTVWPASLPVELKSGQKTIHSSNLFPRSFQS